MPRRLKLAQALELELELIMATLQLVQLPVIQ
jgi:hypothetical protein